MIAGNDDTLARERERRLRQRNWALAGALAAFAAVVFAVSFVKTMIAMWGG